ncbi:mRNA decay protein [Cryptotrichosporon argae]
MSLAEHVAKLPRRRALRAKVETFWLDEAYRPPGQLDSSLKKHTTLINRLRAALLVGPAESIIKEIDAVVLTKYLEEIVAAVVEGASRGKGDTEDAVDIIVHLHARLAPDFFTLLLPPLLAILAPPAPSKEDKDREKEEKDRIAKQRPVLRIIAELALVNAWPEGVAKGAAEVGKILKALMNNDPQYANMTVLASFLKHFNRTYLGAHGDEEPLPADDELVPVEIQKKMRELFVAYFDGASKTLVKGQLRMLEQDRKNHEAYIKSGEIFEDRQHAYERMTRAVERLTTGVNGLAELLGLQPPVLPTAASLAKSSLQIVDSGSSFTVRDDGAVPGGIWDDEEERRFYENLPDLLQLVPSSLLGVKEVQKEATDKGEAARKRDEDDVARQLAQMDIATPAPAESIEMSHGASSGTTASADHEQPPPLSANANTYEDEAESAPVATDEDGLQSGPAARLSALFAALPESVNRETIDKLAAEFAFLNSKAARKRLVRFLAAVPKNRTDLLPHYARFVAVLDPYMPDIGHEVIDALDEELRYLQRKRTVRELDSLRLKNVRFYGELAKFKVARPHTILHVLKVFLDDFRFNIENIANLLETCGRFLLRYDGTASTAKSMVELMRRKQSTSHLDPRHQVMLENAFYQCNPPERGAREVIALTPMQSFIQHLLHDVLMKRTLDKVLKLFRKLHWEDSEVYQYILASFTEIWEIKYGVIPYVAALVYDLQRYHAEFGIAVVDQVMENIRIGMEENIFKHNQRRIASVKYLGELYMYRVVNAAVVFETLWSLLSFGHAAGLPVPGRDSPIDSVDDLFRVRLACTVLDTCGTCFDKGSLRRKLDQYLVVLQLYALCKSNIPMDVHFMLGDTIEALRPDMKRFKTFAEAAAAVDEIMQDSAHDVNDDDEINDEDRAAPQDEVEEPVTAPLDAGAVSDDDAEDVVVIREKARTDEADAEAETDFDREFARALADTTVERKTAAPIFDQAVPILRKAPAGARHATTGLATGPGMKTGDGGKMQFMLLSKRGNKQQVREVDIPVDSAIANNLRSHQLASKAEQEHLKRLVLTHEQRQGQSELHAVEQAMRARGIRTRIVPS